MGENYDKSDKRDDVWVKKLHRQNNINVTVRLMELFNKSRELYKLTLLFHIKGNVDENCYFKMIPFKSFYQTREQRMCFRHLVFIFREVEMFFFLARKCIFTWNKISVTYSQNNTDNKYIELKNMLFIPEVCWYRFYILLNPICAKWSLCQQKWNLT